MNYTRINPYELIKTINELHLKSKAASIVITDDNFHEIKDMILQLSSQSYDIKFQFVIGDKKTDDTQEYQIVRLICGLYGEPELLLQSTPSLIWRTQHNTSVRLKLAALNHFIYNRVIRREMCDNCLCRNDCVERGCAIRVYPSGEVSPCLNNHYSFSGLDLKKNIEDAYAISSVSSDDYSQ